MEEYQNQSLEEAISYCIENFSTKKATKRIIDYIKSDRELTEKHIKLINNHKTLELIPQLIQPNKELFHRSEIIEMLSNYTLIQNRKITSSLPTVKDVKEIVEQVLGVQDISDRSRRREISDARHIYGFICYYQRLGTYYEIGKAIKRDHATILHSFRTTRNYLQSKGHTAFREKYDRVSEAIMSQYENVRL